MNGKLLGAVALSVLAGALALPGAAQATETGPSFATCQNLSGWFVNADETDRKPTATAAGLEFSGDDLIHHNVSGVTTDTLNQGTFSAAPAPDQPSFFSVEVVNTDLSGYATLRWNTTTSKWNMVTGGNFYENANATALVQMTSPAKSKTVVRFGVGYTKNPPGTVTTTVKSVTFNGNTYDLTCAPKPTPTTASPTPSKTATPSPTATTPAPVKDCAAYVYTGTNLTLCDRFPNGTASTVNCTKVGYQVTLKDNKVDPWDLDGLKGNNRGVIGLGCESKPKHPPVTTPTPTKTTTASPTVTPATTRPATATPTATSTTPAPATTGPAGGDVEGEGDLPKTGPSLGILIGAAIIALGAGGGLFFLTRRRKVNYTA